MPNTAPRKPRIDLQHPANDVDAHLEEWVETLRELREMHDDDLDVLMTFLANDNDPADEAE